MRIMIKKETEKGVNENNSKKGDIKSVLIKIMV